MASILKQRRDTTANWASTNPVIPDGQLCFDTTNNTFRIGNGTDTYSALAIQSGVAGANGGGLTDVVNDTTPQLGGNLDTQSFTVDGRDVSTDGTKLDTVATSANNFVHPTSAGNKHIPSGGSADQVLTYSASGTASWQDASAGGGGAMVLIGTLTAGSDNSLKIVEQTSSFDEYMLVVSDLKPSTNSMLKVRLTQDIDNGSTSMTGYDILQHETNNGNDSGMSSIDYNYAQIHTMRGSVDTSGGVSSVMYISNRGTPHLHGTSSHSYAGTPTRTVINSFAGRRRSSMVMGGVDLFFSSGQIVSGRATLYGISHT